MRKTLLITGATGKQGTALINALSRAGPKESSTLSDDEDGYHIYALTRTPPSAKSRALARIRNVTVIEADLDHPETVRRVFEREGGVWGVFCVLAYPGLGMMADLALEYGVHTFVYSSSARCGQKYEKDLTLSSKAKRNIEDYCIELGERNPGLNWTILKPAFFMENLDYFLGALAFSIFKQGLDEKTEVPLIGADDIGIVAAGIFANPERYKHKILTLVGEYATLSQIESSYKRAMNRPIPSVPALFAWLIIRLNSNTQDLLQHQELFHSSRRAGDYPELDHEVKRASDIFPMRSYHDYLVQRTPGAASEPADRGDWNGVSIGKLLLGRL
ncbi:nucleoside-diphosphate-sugar epimerase family protein [Phlyctema vagabunda]|uniref:Nucleoside-diphosphate-sugar epimerase family protein n=1 Tax=Phlyctema vagabunda TaxID=108571 RepID=A0ABR4PGD8_9HELO